MTTCDARSAPYSVPSCGCDSPKRVDAFGDKPCGNCGQPFTDEHSRTATSLCLKKAGHRGRHSWAL